MKKSDGSERWRGCRGSGSPTYTFLEEYKTVQPLWKTAWQFLMKLNMQLLYNRVVSLLGLYPWEKKTYVYTRIYTEMFTEALLIIVKKWNQSRCPSIGKWPCKWNAMGILLGEKKEWIDDTNESLENYDEWKKPVTKATHYMIPFIEHFWNDNLLAKENRLLVARGWGGWGGKKVGVAIRAQGERVLVVTEMFTVLIGCRW